jgi:hypothetical protein
MADHLGAVLGNFAKRVGAVVGGLPARAISACHEGWRVREALEQNG